MELISREQTQRYIQAINKDAVHQICSGQVVLNLATAVKELVENSLDAGATVIEIRLKEYGSELVEVIDNGSGVEESNFEGLTLKHHTSKLREFSDLVSVETFGFRGEALSSLCALSEMSVITRHSSASCGTRLEFDYKGHIVKKKSCARQVGTTISLQNLFSPLPVRQKEFLRNVHREFTKMTQLLYAYCLVSTGTKISCSNRNKKGSTVVVSTLGSETVRENIASVFGAKQVQCLMEFLQKSPNETMLQEYGIPELLAPPENPFHLEGCISSCAHGQGRSATDRQFFYVNNRPCEPKKVIKIVNEVYHQFNQHQYPFVFLNLKTERNCVDVNVTPDKRQVFFDHEKLLIATIKNVSHNPVPQIPSSSQTRTRATGNLTDIFKKWSCSPGKDHSFSPTKHGKGIKRGLDSASSGKSKLHRIDHFFSLKKEERNKELLTEVEISNENVLNVIEISSSSQDEEETKSTEITNVESSDDIPNDVLPDYVEVKNDKCIQNSYKEIHNLKEVKCINSSTATNYNQTNEHSIIISEEIIKDSSVITEIGDTDIKDTAIQKFQNELTDSLEHEVKIANDDDKLIVMTDEEKGVGVKRKIVLMSVSIDSIKQELESKRGNKKNDSLPVVRFRAEIDPSKNKFAESELRKEISKDMFAKMEILGQFNLGFIVTRLDSDLFIIDQHATDEKYNFEMLQLNTVLQNQKLVVPQKLELTAVNESILIENEEIFRKNGFNFIIDQNAEPTKRVQLTSIPISKNWEFGKEDIDELLFMLQDSPHTMCRPSRVRAMFASRACRKSIMIGTALSKADMRRLVDHMEVIEQPWNCPHGRPTMRHLVNLDLIHNE